MPSFGEMRELYWEELLQVGAVEPVLLITGEMNCSCGDEVRLHRMHPGLRDSGNGLSGTRELCDGSMVKPFAYSTSITRGRQPPPQSSIVSLF